MNERRISSEEMKARGYDPATVEERIREEEGHAKAQLLIKEVEEAFQGVPRPKITLRVARGLDDHWKLDLDLAASDPEQDWREVTDEAMDCFQEYFSFSDDEGWRFYLPAFMCQYLRNFPDHGYDAVYTACVKREHLGLLNDEQLACVDKFVALCQQYEVNDFFFQPPDNL